MFSDDEYVTISVQQFAKCRSFSRQQNNLKIQVQQEQMRMHTPIVRLRFPIAAYRIALLCVLAIGLTPTNCLAQYKLEKHNHGVTVTRNGELVADYLTRSLRKPIIWPLIGPDGKRMTRDYPMKPAGKAEKSDHPHHRSLWFTHGDVNGTDFWLEKEGQGGYQKHQGFSVLEDGATAVIASSNSWTTLKGKAVLSDKRRFTFFDVGEKRIVDCEIELIASHGDVNFGDTKEGSFGMRIAGTMKVESKLGGRIVNSEGDENTDAWGVAANWVDYVGPIDGEQMGIAILCHPSTFNHPNRWHVRTYGLFAANPFGVHHFTGQKNPTAGVDLKSGESLTFRYRVVLHTGDENDAKIDSLYKQYAATEFEEL